MEQVSPENLLKIWQNGKSLEDAMWELSDSEIRKVIPQSVQIGYREWRNSGINESYIGAIANECNSSVEMNSYSEQVQSQIDDVLKNVYELIRLGKLIALGFQYPIESDFPIHIPIHMWPPESNDLDNSAIDSNGFKYVNIRIIKSSFLKESKSIPRKKTKITLPETGINNNPGGRPTNKETIIEAYELLKSEKRIDFTKTLKPHTELIQETIRRIDTEIQGTTNISYKTIYSHLSKRFNTDKENFQNRL